MPPRPRSSRICNCGNVAASSSGAGGTNEETPAWAAPPGSDCVPDGKPALSKHSWQRPLGALGASGFPQLGQVGVVSMTVFHTYSSGMRGECYREKGVKTSNFKFQILKKPQNSNRKSQTALLRFRI